MLMQAVKAAQHDAFQWVLGLLLPHTTREGWTAPALHPWAVFSLTYCTKSPQVGAGMADCRKELSRSPRLCGYGTLWEEHRFAARCDTPQLLRSRISPKWEKPRESEVTVKLGDVSPWRDVWLTAFSQHFHPGCSRADVCLPLPPASAPAQPLAQPAWGQGRVLGWWHLAVPVTHPAPSPGETLSCVTAEWRLLSVPRSQPSVEGSPPDPSFEPVIH